MDFLLEHWALFAALVVLAGLAWGFLRFWRIAAVSAGYKAKVLCSALFVSGRNIDPERSPEVSADSYRILRLFRAAIDREKRSVTCSFLGLRARTAIYRPGLGATLVSAGSLWKPTALVPEPPGGEDPWPAPPSESPALKRLVDEAFTEPNPERLRRTRAVLVLQDGRIVAERYAPGFSKGTPLPGWSMTKAVLSALVGILVKEGRQSLSDKSLLPEWSGPGDPRGQIALEDLLRMRSGLRFAEVYSDPLSDVNRMLFIEPDAAAFAAARPLAHPPGTTWQYASGTTNILSRIVLRTVGEKDYPTFPRRALFDSLGMRSAVIEPDAAGTFVGSSYMFATARDWARLGQLYLQDGTCEGNRILPEGWAAFSASPTPQSEGCYGAHWWLKLQKELGGETEAAKRIPSDAFFALGHEDQSLTVIPSRRLVAVRLGLSIYIDAWNHAQFTADLLDALDKQQRSG